MAKATVAITLDKASLGRLDKLVAQSLFASRGQAIQEAVEEKLARLERSRLARESAKVARVFEKALAVEGLSGKEIMTLVW